MTKKKSTPVTSPSQANPTIAEDTVASTTTTTDNNHDEVVGLLRSQRNCLAFLVLLAVVLVAINLSSSLPKFPAPAVGEYMNASVCVGNNGLKKMVFPRPKREAHQLLVKVMAAGGNPVDFKMRQFGQFPLKSIPFVSGYDFAGTVVESDEGSKFSVGTRVFGMLSTQNSRFGSFADFVVADEWIVTEIPAAMSFSQAAAVPLASLTALQALAKLGPVMPKERILIHAGSGGVGMFAIQFAKQLLQLEVFTTSTKQDFCTALGADRVINYQKENFTQFEYDYVLDLMGGETLIRSYPHCKKHYVMVLNSGWQDYFYGKLWPTPFAELATFVGLKLANVLSFGVLPRYDLVFVEPSGEQLHMTAKMFEAGKLTVFVEEEFKGLEFGASQLLAKLESGRTKGKVVLVL